MPLIEIKNLVKNFDKLRVLRGIDLSVKAGEIVVIVGSSGSGKSTLLRCIGQIEEITDGQVKLNGVDIVNQSKQARQILSSVGLVFQQFNLFPHLTVIDNVILALEKVDRMPHRQAVIEANKVLRQLGIFDKAHNYPNSLSGGQQQRVAIARELVRQPKVLMFDEPTSALDPENVDEIETIIKQLSKQKMAILVVSHDIQFALHIADRVVFLHQGKIIVDTTPEKIVKSKKKEVLSFFESALN